MKLAFVLLAILAALVAVHGETKSPTPAAAAGTATVVGATGAAAGSTVPAIVKAGIPISVGNLTTTSGATTATVQGATANVTITGTGATGGFVGQPTIVGATGATVSIASPGAAIVGAAGASPAASGAAVISLATRSPAASGAAVVTASPAASGAARSPAASPVASAVVIVISPSPAASGAASPAASGAASPTASAAVIMISPSPAVSGAASPSASGAASPAASGAASPTASAAVIVISPSPAVSGAASPAASASRAPLASASPAALVSAADFFPPMPTYGEQNFQFTCPNATMQAMVEVSLEPLLIGIDAVSSIKFAGCPSLMYVATKAGQIFEVTIDNSTSAVTQVRLILDLSNEIAGQSTQASTSGGTSGATTSATSGAATTSGANPADQPGLLGMAFPPDFASSGLFYVYFSSSAAAGGAASATAGGASATAGGASSTTAGATISPSAGGAICGNESTMLNHVNRLAEYRLDPASGIANFSRTLLELRWPFANGNGDNSLEFAPGSMLLFLGVGDGGSSFDPFENAQNPDVLLGKVLVFDLSSLSSNASCNQSVLRLSELNSRCPSIAEAITTFATGLHSPAGFEFLNPSAQLEASSCPGGANATAAGGANSTMAGGANATAAGGANATMAGGANATTAGGANATAAGGANVMAALSSLAPRVIAPDRGQGQYEEVNIMEQIGANYGWDIMQGWSCIDQSLELCPQSTSGMANATLAANQTAGGANATMAGGANATAAGGANATTAGGANATAAGGANATTAGGANATMAGGANLTATNMGVLPAAVIPHNCRRLNNPQAILGGRLYEGSELDPMLRGAYIFGATTSLQNGNESLPTGNGALYFLRPESFSGNAVADLTMCPSTAAAAGANATGAANATTAGGANATTAGGANATTAGGANATTAGGANATTAGGANATTAGGANATMGGFTTTGSGVNTSFIPNSRLEVFPVTINYQFFPTQHFFTAVGADASRSRLFLGVSSTQGATGGIGGVFRLIPFNEGPQNPAIISATNLRPGQIVFSANATAMASPSAAASPSP